MNFIQSVVFLIKREFAGWHKFDLSWMVFSLVVIFCLSISKDSYIAIIAAMTGCLAAIFTGVGKLGAFVFGLINSLLYGYISYKYQYYGEVMVKAFVFIPLNIYGFITWKANFSDRDKEVIKRSLSVYQRLMIAIALVVVTSIYGCLLSLLNGKLPFFDGFSTILAVVALILCVQRYREHWILWIIINCVNIYLWIAPFIDGRGKPIAILLMWIFYLFNSIIMYFRWKKYSQLPKEIL